MIKDDKLNRRLISREVNVQGQIVRALRNKDMTRESEGIFGQRIQTETIQAATKFNDIIVVKGEMQIMKPDKTEDTNDSR